MFQPQLEVLVGEVCSRMVPYLLKKPLNKGTGLRPRKIRNVLYWSTRFAWSDGTLIIWQIELNTKTQPEFLVFNSAFG